MKERENSFYKNAVILNHTRKFLASFLDSLLVFLLSLVFFAIGDAVLGVTPAFEKAQSSVVESQQSLYEIVESSGLSQRVDGRLLTPEEMSETYLKSSVLKTILEIKSPEEIGKSAYQNVKPITPDTDPVFKYFVMFKKKNENNFTEESKDKCGSSYYIDIVLGEEGKAYFEVQDGYPYLNEETALAIDEFYVSGSTYGQKVYESLKDIYSQANRKGREDLVSGYLPYLTEDGVFEEGRDGLLQMRGIVLLSTYLLAVAVVFLVFPLVFRDGRTLSDRFLEIGFCDISGKKFGVANHLLRLLFSWIGNLFVPFFVAILTFGGQGIHFMDINVLGFFNIFTGLVVSVVYLLVSGILDLVPRSKGHQTLTELLSLIVAKDGKEFRYDEEGIYGGK